MLKSRDWSRIDLIGDKPLKIIGGRKEGISQWRGSPINIPVLGDKIVSVPTLHPSYLMRDQELLPVASNDLGKSLVVPAEHYNIYPSLEDVDKFDATEFSFDIETTIPKAGERPIILLVGLSAKETEGIVVPFRGGYISRLRGIFSRAKSVIGHNCLQFDLPILSGAGIDIGRDCQVWDTMLLQHLRFPNLPHDLEFVSSQFTSKPAWKAKKTEREPGAFETYCARDTDVTLQIYRRLKPLVEEEGLLELYKLVQTPLAKICRLMQTTGFKVDPSRIKSVRENLLKEMGELELLLPKELRSYDKAVTKRAPAPEGTVSEKTGKPVKFIAIPATERVTPWRSTEQKKKFLYGKDESWQLGLEPVLDVKSGKISTGKLALDKLFRLSKNHSIPALKRLNAVDELVTTFCKEDMVHSISRMHPHFNVHGTASGRLSSSDPNLQNIPQSARFLYVPSHSGWSIIDVDYAGIENRITAFLANDKWRLDNFERDPDFSEHKYLAAVIDGCDYDEVEKDNTPGSTYFNGKKTVHGVNYGLGALKLSKMFDLDFKEVKKFMTIWKGIIKDTIRWQERTASSAKEDGFLVTPFSRKRWFYTSSYFTESLSFIPQSTAADVIFRAMIGLMYERIEWPIEQAQKIVPVVCALPHPARLLIQVHDSLVFECPNEIVPQVVKAIKLVMEQPWPELKGFTFPIGIKVGPSWAECETYKEN